MPVTFHALPSDVVAAYRAGAPDANGLPPERSVSNGAGNPCRHCLKDIPEGVPMLTLAHRPFDDLHPYAELGPIFLCADGCERHPDTGAPPEMLTKRLANLIKGYGPDNRIVYGTGKIVPAEDTAAYCAEVLARPGVAYLHARSWVNNCYFLRVDRA